MEFINYLDSNADGIVDPSDCPFEYGTLEAKQWWNNYIVPYTKTQITSEMKEKYGDNVVGAWKGKPLVPGHAGRGEGDFQFLVDKIQITQGLSEDVAKRIAGKAFWRKYGL
jgi:hypothetical protein